MLVARLECTKGTSNKYWEFHIALTKENFIATGVYGPIGKKGTVIELYNGPDRAEADKAIEKKMRSKIPEYTLVSDKGFSATKNIPTKKSATKIRQDVWSGVDVYDEAKTDKNTNIVQLKYDGSMYHLHIVNGKAIALTSKRISKKTGLLSEKLENFPALKDYDFSDNVPSGYTELVGEVSCEHIKSIRLSDRDNYVAGIMNSSPDNPDIQGHDLRFIVHDVMMWDGEEVKGTYFERKDILKKCAFPKAGLFGENVVLTKSPIFSVTSKIVPRHLIKSVFEEFVARGFEGIIIRTAYEVMKLKKQNTCDCIIIGFTEGKGKYKGMIGAIELGVFSDKYATMSAKILDKLDARGIAKRIPDLLDAEKLIPIANISGFDDALRKRMSKNRSEYVGRIVRVTYMKMKKRLFQPRFDDFRTDKPYSRCTYSQTRAGR